jgi:tellurite resistance protein
VTPGERNIVKSLIAVAWADGRMESSEVSVIEGLLTGFDASEDEERELLDFARTRRSLEDDIPLTELAKEDRELLFSNAVLLVGADGSESKNERAVLKRLARVLELEPAIVDDIIAAVRRTPSLSPGR